ncbi:urease accessory protein UreF [Micrococcales bacterium 31B]|nr:urease accessory protein UreF [Micrococcales bacterium 31B]
MAQPPAPTYPAEVLTLLLADSRLPTGAHTQSAGIEPALIAGLSLARVPEYIATRLATVTLIEAGTAVLARHLWVSGRRGELLALHHEWAARTIAAPLRDASHQLARGYLRLGSRLFPALAHFSTERSVPWCRGVVFGALAAEAGLDARATGRLVAYDEVQTIVAAALKIQPFDPATAAQWSLSLSPSVEAVATAVAPLTDPSHLPAVTAPLMEHWSQQHSQLERRLFRA